MPTVLFDRFSPPEQRDIQESALGLVREGKSRDQALALALDSSARETARGITDFSGFVDGLFEELDGSGFFQDFPGSNSTWRENANGTWDMEGDIELMGVVPKGRRNNDEDVGEDWMVAAVAKHSANERDSQHLSPVFVRHHGQQVEEPEIAGFVRLTRVAHAHVDGVSQPTIFGQFLKVPAHIFREIKRFRLPFRSVEVADWAKFEISGVALLSTRSPYFKQPMTTVGREITHPEVTEMAERRYGSAVARFAGEEGASYLFDERKTAQLEGDPPKNEEDDETAEAGDVDLESLDLAAALALIKQLMGVKKKIDEAVSDDGASAPTVDDGNSAPVPAIAASDDPAIAKLQEQMAMQAGQIAAMKTAEEERVKTAGEDAAVASALSSLKGYNIPDNMGEQLSALAKANGSSAPAALAAFTSAFTQNATQDPPETVDGMLAATTRRTESPEVAQFATQGPRILAAARRYDAMYDDLLESGAYFSEECNRLSFIEESLASEGRQAVAAQREGREARV